MTLLGTRQVLLRILAVISVVEIINMLVLGALPYELGLYTEALVDAAVLGLLSTPLIYLLVIRPFVAARDDAVRQLDELAHSDPLTQLPNRRLLSIHLDKFLAHAVRHGIGGAVLMMDLDRFKRINDVHGHDAGDAVLLEVARRLRAHVRGEDVPGRLGGDEFVILLPHLDTDARATHDKALHVAHKLVRVIGRPIEHDGLSLSVGASIGIRLLGFDPDEDGETALTRADAAMYRAKHAGSGGVAFHEAGSRIQQAS